MNREPRGRGTRDAGLALFLAWIGLGMALIGWWAWAWSDPEGLDGLRRALERAYGLRPGEPRFLLAADGHLHLLTGGLAALWLGLACRLFVPRANPWLPIVAVAVVGIADEALQALSPGRHLDLLDVVWTGVGILLAAPVLVRLGRAGRRPSEPQRTRL